MVVTTAASRQQAQNSPFTFSETSCTAVAPKMLLLAVNISALSVFSECKEITITSDSPVTTILQVTRGASSCTINSQLNCTHALCSPRIYRTSPRSSPKSTVESTAYLYTRSSFYIPGAASGPGGAGSSGLQSRCCVNKVSGGFRAVPRVP